jgi:glycosyltransferase involved in cell wall biosynthesis
MPQVSVVTSVHNGKAYLEECVNSTLNETFQDEELSVARLTEQPTSHDR